MHVLVATQLHQHLLAPCLLPLLNGLQPEFHKVVRARKLFSNRLNDVWLVGQGIQCVEDILLVILSERVILHVIEIVGHEDTLVTHERHRLWKHLLVDVIG